MQVYNFIDATAHVPASAKVWHFAVILADVTLGARVSIGSNTEIGRGSTICDDSRISSHVFLPARSIVGKHVFIGPGVTFTDDRYPKAGNANYRAEPPTICDYASIGAGSVILPGVTIGSYAIIGAGSTVTKDVPPHGKIFGPAARHRVSDNLDLFTPVLGDELEP
jgi:UDP-2-acetamido-3-amino-2,3-dideoxy-glucuronate N-acetyltransferase